MGVRVIYYIIQTVFPFSKVWHVVVFLMVSILAGLVNSSIGSTTLLLFGIISGKEYTLTLVNWLIGDSVGIVTFATTVLAFQKNHFKLELNNILELMTLLAVLAACTWLLYASHYPLSFLLLPVSVWATYRFRLYIACCINLIISIIIIFGAIHGHTEFVVTNVNDTIIFVQAFITVVFIGSLILYALQCEREEAYHQLRTLNLELEDRVKEKTRDISEKNKSLEITLTKLKQAQSQLVQSEKMASLGVLTAGIAHEINNPINFVSANVQPLTQDINDLTQLLEKYRTLPLPAEYEDKQEFKDIQDFSNEIDLDYLLQEIKKLLSGIQEGTTRTANIVSDLRVFSRLDESAIKKADLHQNIDSTLSLLNNQFKNRITINRHYGNVPEIECYPSKLNQVFMNVLLNAIQAIPDKGQIDITTSKIDNSVSIEITDRARECPVKNCNEFLNRFTRLKRLAKELDWVCQLVMP